MPPAGNSLNRKMVRVFLGVMVMSTWLGCAGPRLRPGGLRVEITPEEIYAGALIQLVVYAPPGTREVSGRLDLPGSPNVPLKSSDQGRTWQFKTQIPLGVTWVPGRYKVIVQGTAPDGALLQGETWVKAQ